MFHSSLLIAHYSLLIAHCSLLIAHSSLLIAHCSLLIPHYHASQFLIILSPIGVNTLSGWNCTPWTSKVLCCNPMIKPFSSTAVISSSVGKSLSLTIQEW